MLTVGAVKNEAGQCYATFQSQRMKAALRESVPLADIGGDELIAVMVDLDNTDNSASN
jgi:hypothetical protein